MASPSAERPPTAPRFRFGFRAVGLPLLLLVGGACGGVEGPAGTPELRGALFDTIVARTARRDAFSPPKQRALDYDPLIAMRAMREVVVGAGTEEELFYALARLSHSRRNRHLDVALVPGGLTLADAPGIDRWPGGRDPVPVAPVRIFPDYGPEGGYFVGDLADHPSLPARIAPGDRVLSVHGLSPSAYEETVRPYHRHSSVIGLRWRVAEGMGLDSGIFPPSLRREALELELRHGDGETGRYTLPYLPPGSVRFRGISDPRYPGYRSLRSTPTWDLLLPEVEFEEEGWRGSREAMLLLWTGFRETMVADVDTLVALGEREGLLHRPLVVDVTRSRGGSLGAYAIQRLQPRPFRTTFGNLRLSDLTPSFIDSKRADFLARNINDGGVPETMDDGRWLMDWLETDVLEALERGDDYSNDVPFKSAHAPKDSDGLLQPTPLRFEGPIAIISGPQGGSHLDQFNAIFVDNALGPVVGMSAGGFSNTWEWEEVLTFPGTDRPVIGWMYDMGHTIRPNGEILEGNPAQPHHFLPLTAEGSADYYHRLLAAALAALEGWEVLQRAGTP